MSDAAPRRSSLYPTRSGAGALLGQQLAGQGYQSCILLGITPEGVEIAAHAAKAMGAQLDVIVASFIKLGSNLAPIGAMAESAPAEMDPDFLPGMNLLEKLQAAIDESRARVKQDLVLYRTQRPVKNLQGRTVVIVDDVLYTGRTIRAALDELADFGRPRLILLCVLIDRGGRELPIQPDIVGLRQATRPDERIDVQVKELDGKDHVELVRA